MSGRSTAEIVADLRKDYGGAGLYGREAADRLEYLDGIVDASHDKIRELEAEIESLKATSGRSGVR